MVKEIELEIVNGNSDSKRIVPTATKPQRLDCIPILHVRGTNYEVGYSIGRTFKSIIKDMIETWEYFNDVLWKAYVTEDGQLTYLKCLNHCMQKFPNYVDEIRGMSDGSSVSFEKLFLLNIDSMITGSENPEDHVKDQRDCHGETGCTSIICNNTEEVILGHTEDAMSEILNNVYIVSAEIVDKNGKKLESFTTFSYAAHLVGYTMGFNPHGMVWSVNALFPAVHKSGTPRAFIARAILGARNLDELLDILRDTGTGIADGFSLNVHFAKEEGPRLFYNVEILPPSMSDNSTESVLDILTINSGETCVHCNKYLRLNAMELPLPITISSNRHVTLDKFPKPNNLKDVKMLLSDQSDPSYPIYICDTKRTKMSFCKTVAVGFFNLVDKTWSIYLGQPSNSEPVVVIPLNF